MKFEQLGQFGIFRTSCGFEYEYNILKMNNTKKQLSNIYFL
jgi:hypothetical protein